MVSFKISQDRFSDVYKLTEDNFEKYAMPKEKYTRNVSGKTDYFAVCPFCDNPVIIHGFYERTNVSDAPYASHYPDHIKGFKYNNLTKEHCPAYTGRRTSRKKAIN